MRAGKPCDPTSAEGLLAFMPRIATFRSVSASSSLNYWGSTPSLAKAAEIACHGRMQWMHLNTGWVPFVPRLFQTRPLTINSKF